MDDRIRRGAYCVHMCSLGWSRVERGRKSIQALCALGRMEGGQERGHRLIDTVCVQVHHVLCYDARGLTCSEQHSTSHLYTGYLELDHSSP